MKLNEARARGKKACQTDGKFTIVKHPQRGFEFTLHPARFEQVVEGWTYQANQWKRD